jgi:hypothetical protein
MSNYRLSKYRPDVSSHDEWTSVSDIGRTHGGEALTHEAYLRVESLYLDAIADFIALADVAGLNATDVEQVPAGDIAALADADGLLAGDTLREVARKVLREELWCRLAGAKGTYVHFGYDYIVYLGSDAVSDWLPPAGLYAEPMPSPHARISGE